METLFSYPEFAEIDGKKYKINTDYRVAIKCNDISMQNISIQEKTMAIIYLLFGDEALEDTKHYEQFIEKAFYFLNCGNTEQTEESKDEPDMDFIQDFPYIEASFMSDYKISLENANMHWWKFYYLLCGLSQSEMGNSCVLNRIRDLRNRDLSKIDDPVERNKIQKAQEHFALKRNKKQKRFSEEEIKAMEEYHKLIGE